MTRNIEHETYKGGGLTREYISTLPWIFFNSALLPTGHRNNLAGPDIPPGGPGRGHGGVAQGEGDAGAAGRAEEESGAFGGFAQAGAKASSVLSSKTCRAGSCAGRPRPSQIASPPCCQGSDSSGASGLSVGFRTDAKAQRSGRSTASRAAAPECASVESRQREISQPVSLSQRHSRRSGGYLVGR